MGYLMLRYNIKYKLYELSRKGSISDAQTFIAGALLDSISDEQLDDLGPTYVDTLLALIELDPETAQAWLND